MKRKPLKRKARLKQKTRIKRKKPLRRRSARQRLKQRVFDLIREVLKRKRGKRCELCGSTKPVRLGLFHIMNQSTHRRIIFHKANLLLACWFPCHKTWHSDPHKADDIYKPIIRGLRGDNYRDWLTALDSTGPRMTDERIAAYHAAYKRELDELSKRSHNEK